MFGITAVQEIVRTWEYKQMSTIKSRCCTYEVTIRDKNTKSEIIHVEARTRPPLTIKDFEQVISNNHTDLIKMSLD